ncbi:MAG: flagellar basal body rod C-terminal domain-containing protein, partial [Acidovorax sp.]|nr:flagellar basal body rod C-terminal domain-containing protein [Acidovorax sp.]
SLKATGLIYKDPATAAAATPPGAIKPENPAVGKNLTLKFDGAGGYSVFQPGSATPFATGTYTPGQPISVPNGDWQITVQGSPKDGDTITLGHSLDTALYGDAYKRDTGNGKALMELRDAVMFEGATLQDGWANSIANIGTRTQSAQYAANMSTAIANNLEADRVAVSGVNLDEEAAKLIQYQQAYQASAKMLQIAQGIFDNLLQAVGR